MTATDDGNVAESPQPSGPVDGPTPSEIRQAAGIYGLIVTAAVLASAGGHLRTIALGIAVFVTLVVYWLAEEYSQIGEQASAGHLPGWPHVRASLAAKWPMVSASYIPLVVLFVDRLVGASASTAAYTALAFTVGLLTVYGWSAGRRSGLRGVQLVLMTFGAAALGLLMIGLKILITHLH